jgi:hypothetical protein
MQYTSKTHETYDCNMCSSTCCPLIRLVDAKLKVGRGRQGRKARAARGVRVHGTRRAVRGQADRSRSEKDGRPEGIIIVKFSIPIISLVGRHVVPEI